MHEIKNSYLLDGDHDPIELSRLAHYHKANYGQQYEVTHVSDKSITIKTVLDANVTVNAKRIERRVKETFSHLTAKMIQVAIVEPFTIDNTCQQ